MQIIYKRLFKYVYIYKEILQSKCRKLWFSYPYLSCDICIKYGVTYENMKLSKTKKWIIALSVYEFVNLAIQIWILTQNYTYTIEATKCLCEFCQIWNAMKWCTFVYASSQCKHIHSLNFKQPRKIQSHPQKIERSQFCQRSNNLEFEPCKWNYIFNGKQC